MKEVKANSKMQILPIKQFLILLLFGLLIAAPFRLEAQPKVPERVKKRAERDIKGKKSRKGARIEKAIPIRSRAGVSRLLKKRKLGDPKIKKAKKKNKPAKEPVVVAAPVAKRKSTGALPGEKEFNECVKIPRRQKIKVTLKPESDLNDLVAWISSMTCKKFILPGNLRSQKVTLISPRPVTAAMAYRAFISALDVMGLTVVPSGGYLKVVQGNWAIQSAIPTYGDKKKGSLPHSDQIVTQIIQVKNVDVNELLLVFNKMKSRSGDITAYRPANCLIVTDSANRIRRMLKILKELDVPVAGDKIWVVRIKNADAEEVNKILQQVFSQKGNKKSPPKVSRKKVSKKVKTSSLSNISADAVATKIVTDTMTNSLIIVASADDFKKILSLIRKVDIAGEGVNQRIHVYYLENANADELAQTIAGLTTGAASRGTSRGRVSRRTSRNKKTTRSSGPATLFEGDVKVNADKATNSLVIVASNKDYLALRRVIKRLDIPRRQVFVEAVIMEVSLDNSNKLGFAYHGGKLFGEGSSESIGFGGVQHSDWQSMLINPLSMMGLAAGARGALLDGSQELLGVSADIPGFGIMFQAMQLDNNINVLSSPHILTTDNEEAEISVGQNLPFQGAIMGGGFSSAAAGTSASLIPSVSVQRQDVALKMKLTPHVNDSDMVRLELEQEVSDIVSENFGGLGPATSKRTAKTTVVVRDQQTIVIGGMMRESENNIVSKVPLLGDIPILGYLFKYRTKKKLKTNLLIILTPYIIRDQSDLRRIFRKKMKERREFIERYTSFQPHDVGHEIDYRHKRGLLSEINRVGMQVENEAALLKQGSDKEEVVEGVDLPSTAARKTSSSGSVEISGGKTRPVEATPIKRTVPKLKPRLKIR